MPSGYSIYVDRETYVHNDIDPRTKSLGVITVFALSLMYNAPLPLALILLALFPVALVSQLPGSTIRFLMLSTIWFVVLSLVIWPAYVHVGLPLFHVFGSVPITWVGIQFGLAMGIRVAVMVFAAGIWMATTSPQKLTAAFLKSGMPYKVGTVISSTIRLVPLIVGEWSTIVEAQKARGLNYQQGGIIRRLSRSVRILGPMILRSLDIAQSLAMAMDARAYGAYPRRTNIVEVNPGWQDRAILAGFGILLVFGIYCRTHGIGVLLPHYL